MDAEKTQYFETAASQVRVIFLPGSIVRVTHVPLGAAFPPDRPWSAHVFPAGLAAAQDSAAPDPLEARLFRGQLHLAAGPADFYEEAAVPVFKKNEAASFSIRTQPQESFYGWGEWFNGFRRRKGRLRLQAQDSPAFLQGRQTYSAIPFFISSRGYAFLLLNSRVSTWQINPTQEHIRVAVAGPPLDYLVIWGPEPRQLLSAYTTLVGRPPLLPRWAFGLWGTGYPQENQDQVLALVDEHRRRNIPLDAVILDYHWEEGFHNFKWRSSLFPDPAKLIAGLQRQQVHLGLIFTPFVNQHNQPWKKAALQLAFQDLPRGHEHDDERALPEYEEALAQGYLAHPRAEWWFGVGGMLDFTNPAAAAWWNRKLEPLYRQGVDFFKNDDGEYLPREAHSHLGLDGAEYHNLYGFFYGKALYEGLSGLDNRRPLIYARSVWAGSQRYPALFLGDQKPTFTHLRQVLQAGLNLSLAGFAYWTPDVFGLDGPTTPETHMRYAQLALLAPVARYFWRPAYLDQTRYPWSHNSQVEENFRRYAHLRYQLLPYLVTAAWQAFLTGLPILRPLVLEFGFGPAWMGCADQVMLGDSLMLCPVVAPGARHRKIILPPGVWHDFWSQETFSGEQTIELPAPLERMPILIRGGALVPMGPALNFIPSGHQFNDLQLHCWPPYPAQVRLYDEDGSTRDYLDGAYAVTSFVLEEVERGLELTIAPVRNGGFPGQARSLEICLHRLPAAPRIVRMGTEVSAAWQYDPVEKSASIPLQIAADQNSKIMIEFQENRIE